MKVKILILLAIISIKTYSQETTLFGKALPEDIYYDLDGSWRFDLSSAIKGDPSDIFRNFIFEMTPDLTASIWLYNKFFFETEITEISENNLFLFGYQSSDLGLQEVRIGNSELEIEEYAGYTPPKSEKYNPGTRLKYVTERTTQEVLVRYSKEIQESVKYIGNNLVQEFTISATDYIRGQFFIIPVYTGNEKLYNLDGSLKELDRSSYIYYKEKNLLYISKEFNNLYISGSSNDNLGSDDLVTTTIDGIELINIYNSGEFSPIEFLGAYELGVEAGESNELFIGGSKTLNYETLEDILILYDYLLDKSSPEIKHPLLELDSRIYENGSGLEVPVNLLFRSLTEIDSIVLDDVTMENSFYILINGVYYTDYTFNNDSKVLTINRELSPFDVVEIRYKNTSNTGTGNLLGVYGGNFSITDNLDFELSTVGNWSFIGEDYSDEIDESSAYIDMTGELIYSSDRIQGSVKGDFSLLNPDTSKGFELFSYDTQKKLLTTSELTLSQGEGNTLPLISREGNFIIDSLEELESLEVNGLDIPYLISYRDGNETSKVIVFEVPSLGNGNKSSGRLDLGENRGDYSSYKSFNFSILRELERDIEILFNCGSESFSKTIPATSTLEFNSITIDFSYSERQSLKYLKSMDFIFREGERSTTLIKDLNFTGDRVWTYDSSGTIYLSEDSGSLLIRNIDSSEIKLETFINEFVLDNYNSIEFTLENNSLLTENSIMTMDIYSSNGKSRRYIQGPGLVNRSKIKINIADGETLNNSSNDDRIVLSITDTSPQVGALKISPIILKDPNYSFDSNYSGDIIIYSDLAYKINSENFISLDTIFSKGFYNDNTSNISGGVSGSLLFGDYNIESEYLNDKAALSYSYLFPGIDFPISLFDSYSYNDISTRLNYIEVDTPVLYLKYTLSGYISELSKIRENSLDSSLNLPLKVYVSGELSQKDDNSIEPSLEDAGKSYSLILPQNTLKRENSFSGAVNLESTLGFYKPALALEGEFTQKYNNLYSIDSLYRGMFNNNFNFKNFEIGAYISSEYKNRKEEINSSNLSEGYRDFTYLFTEDNPFTKLNFDTLFINDNPIENYRISNKVGTSITLEEVKSKYNFLLPSGGSFTLLKEGNVTGDLITSIRSFTTGIDFKFNNTIKNSGSFTFKEGLLNSEDNLSINLDTLILWEINRDNNLDITNSYTYSDQGFTNLTEIDYSWLGKSGPLYIIPVADILVDSPYKYSHIERGYFLFGDDTYKVGLRHETKLEINETNETEAYIDVIYEDNENEPFSFSLGINTTLIF